MVWRNKNLKKVKVGRIRQMVFNLHNPGCTQILEQACRVSQVIRPSILVIPYTHKWFHFCFWSAQFIFLTLTIDDSSMSEFQECSQFILRGNSLPWHYYSLFSPQGMFFRHVAGGRWVIGRLVFATLLSPRFVMGKRKFLPESHEDFESIAWESLDTLHFEHGKSLPTTGFLKDKIF